MVCLQRSMKRHTNMYMCACIYAPMYMCTPFLPLSMLLGSQFRPASNLQHVEIPGVQARRADRRAPACSRRPAPAPRSVTLCLAGGSGRRVLELLIWLSLQCESAEWVSSKGSSTCCKAGPCPCPCSHLGLIPVILVHSGTMTHWSYPEVAFPGAVCRAGWSNHSW